LTLTRISNWRPAQDDVVMERGHRRRPNPANSTSDERHQSAPLGAGSEAMPAAPGFGRAGCGVHVVEGAVVVVPVSVTAVVVILRRALVLRDVVQGGCGCGGCRRSVRLAVGGGRCARYDVHDEERDERPESEHEPSSPPVTGSHSMASHGEHRMEGIV